LDNKRPIIIIKKVKKVKKIISASGAWKIAYADFVTAMMAFFLVMWLLAAVSADQLEGVSRFFTPIGVNNGTGGSNGVLGGKTVSQPGFLTDNQTSPGMAKQGAGRTIEDGFKDSTNNNTDESESTDSKSGEEFLSEFDVNPVTKKPYQDQIDQFILDKENRAFEDTKKQLMQAIQEIPDFHKVKESLVIDQTPEGLRIQIVDQKKLSMFPKGKTNMYRHTYNLIKTVSKVITGLDNLISVSGHTDANPFSKSDFYGNWELSSDRANASRRVLIENGFPEHRIYAVMGKASTDPLVAGNKSAERNRRISITLRRKTLDKDRLGGSE